MIRFAIIIAVIWVVIISGSSGLTEQSSSVADNFGAAPTNDNRTTRDANTTKEADADVDAKGNPSEIQKAVCTVTAGEVRASAEAVTTKTLKGVCGSVEMHLAFSTLEARLEAELFEIKEMLQQLAKFHGFTIQATPKKLNNLPTPTDMASSSTPMSLPALKLHAIQQNKTSEAKPRIPVLKSLESTKAFEREREISQFNNTLLTDQDLQLFTYYWKLENLTDRLQSDHSNTVESPVFSIKGKTLHLRATFRHLQRDYLYLQLSHAQLKTSNRNNIVLDMGGLFKQIKQTEHVLFKHKISILDQHNRRFSDLASQEFNNLDMGFSIPNSALYSSSYIKHDSLLIQLILYL